jgi:archaemetzincin
MIGTTLFLWENVRLRRYFLFVAVVGIIALSFVLRRGKFPGVNTEADDAIVHNNVVELQRVVKRLRPLQKALGKPQPGDWLAEHQEDGQTFEQYLERQPQPFPKELSTLYIQPIGEFSPTQRQLVATTAQCLERFYGHPVKMLPGIGLDDFPPYARRISNITGQTQVLSTYVLHTVLTPRRPRNAIAVLALSAEDLWPGPGWNYVFGQASLIDRVGVWSIQRFGDPDRSPEAYQLCLERTLGTALHETGHMLGIKHCIAAECGMNGSNSLEEKDRGVLYFCADCQAKVWWSCDLAPQKHLAKMAQFATDTQLKRVAEYWEQAGRALQPTHGKL